MNDNNQYVASSSVFVFEEGGMKLEISKGNGEIVRVVGCIHGNPITKPPPRTNKGSPVVYNPLNREMKAVRTRLRNMILNSNNSSITTIPVFHKKPDESLHALYLSVIYCVQRPLSDFKSSKRKSTTGSGLVTLKETAPARLDSHHKDVDNLCKYLLDILTGVMYEDDKQISCLKVIRTREEAGGDGYTKFFLRKVRESDWNELQHEYIGMYVS